MIATPDYAALLDTAIAEARQGLAEGASTRMLIHAGKLLRAGAPVDAAIRAAILLPITDEPERPRRKSGLVWGPYKPRPAWKWAAFGVSAGLMGLSAVALAVTGIPVAQSNNRKGFLYDRLEEKAQASLMNSSTIDDVNPEVVLDICSDVEGSGGALEVLDESDGVATPGVRNVEVGRECRKGQAWANVATASGIALGVFTLTTAIFTTLLFVHRESPAVNAMVRRKVHVGATPDLEGRGVSFTGGFKF